VWQQLYSPNDRLRSVEVGQNADGRLEAFGIATDGRVLQTWQTAPNNGWIGRWQELYSPADQFTDLRVARNQDGRLEVFAIAPDNRVFQTWQTAPNNGWIGRWQELYSPENRLASLEVGQNADGRLEVFGIAPDGRVWQTWQTAPNNGWNGRWQELYSPADRFWTLRVGRNQDGRLEVFAIDTDDAIRHTWQTAPNNGWNGQWEYLNSPSGRWRRLDVGQNADGRLEVFAIARDDDDLHSSDNRVWQTWQTAPNNGWNGRWQELYASPADQFHDLRVGRNQDGRLEVFGIDDPFNRVFQTWQTAPNNGWNGRWQDLSTRIRVLIKVVTTVTSPLAAPTPITTSGPIDTMVANMRTVFGTAGIRISEGPRENITVIQAFGTPPQTVFNVGPCNLGQALTADQNRLFANRNNAGPNDIVIYFVSAITTTGGPLVGCVVRPSGPPAAIVVAGAPAWTMAHEVGHVLGLTHITGEHTGCPTTNPQCCLTADPTRIMTGCNLGAITGTPTLSQGEIDAAQGSNLIRRDRLRQLAVASNADGRLEVFGVAPDDQVWHTWQTAPNNGWNEGGA
jgi:hypothetical protein